MMRSGKRSRKRDFCRSATTSRPKPRIHAVLDCGAILDLPRFYARLPD